MIKLNNVIFYFTDQKIYFKKSYHEIKTSSKILNNGYILEENKFIQEMSSIIKKENINRKLIGDQAFIIINDFYNPQYIKYLKFLFQELQFSKVTFIKESELIAKDNIIIIDYNFTRLFNLTNSVEFISTTIFKLEYLKINKKAVEKLPFINKLKILNYTKEPFNLKLKSQIYFYTYPCNYLIDKYFKIINSTNSRK